MKRGGNAVDAAIAVAFALAVTHPAAGNLAGGGFMMIRLRSGKTTAIDYREMAPVAATRNVYLDKNGNLIEGEGGSLVGYRAAGVPGTRKIKELTARAEQAERALKALGVARALVAEESRVKTAAAAVVFHRPANETPFESGRAFYRLWLELTAAGFVACPMSSIADSTSGSGEVRARWRVSPGRRVMNVLRVGKAPGEPPRSPRLPASEVLVAEGEMEHAR